MTSKKKTYSAPKLTVHGNVKQLTQQGGLPNADAPNGVPTTAFPAAG